MSIFTYKNLYNAYLECRKNKRKTSSALEFETDLEDKLFELLIELKDYKYTPGKSTCFVVKYPKTREIFAANFRDRVVHHLFLREILEMSEKSLFFNSFACRKNKGTHKAVNILQRYIKKVSRNGKKQVFFLQLDLRSFFVSIDYKILYKIFIKFIEKQKKSKKWKMEIVWLAKQIIFHKPQDNCFIRGDRNLLHSVPKHKSLFGAEKGKGLPIGNYSSQFFANLYLNELDYFIKQKLRIKYYVRYMDDFILFDYDKNELEKITCKISDFLGDKLMLNLNSKKTKLKNIKEGIDFLGYFIKPDYVLVRKRVAYNCRKKIHGFFLEGLDSDNLGKTVACLNSYFGHFRYANSFKLRKKIALEDLKYFNNFLKFDENFLFSKIIKKSDHKSVC